MPINARKPYPKPWLQHTRGSDGERSPKISALKKKQSPRHGGEILWDKKESPLLVDSVLTVLVDSVSRVLTYKICNFFRVLKGKSLTGES